MALRKCKSCGLEAHTKQDLEQFTRNPPSKYGYQNLCKPCRVTMSRQYTEKHRGETQEYQRQYHQRPEYQNQRKQYDQKYYETHKEEILEKHRQYLQTHRKQVNARTQAGRHTSLADHCLICGDSEQLERHHPDYDRPKDIITVCRLCHVKIHR